MIVDDLFENVAGPEKCWTGYRKVGTKPGTGGNTDKRVNDCEKIKESSGDFGIGDPVIITGDVKFRGKTGDVREIGQDGAFVVVNLYNYGPYSFHTSDVSYNDYADAEDEEDVAEDSLEEINFQNRSTSNSGTGELRGVNIPSTMRHPGWKEPTWSFQEIAQKLGISTSALNLLAFKSIGGFPEAVPGLAARHGSKKYYKQSEVKRWVNANNVREKLKQGVAEADAEKIGDRYDPEEFDDMMLRLKTLAGAGPLKTVWDPQKRVYRNVPINQPQDKK
jgi:hypothetical protein